MENSFAVAFISVQIFILTVMVYLVLNTIDKILEELKSKKTEKNPTMVNIEGDWIDPFIIIKLTKNGKYFTVVQTSLNPNWPIQIPDEDNILYNHIL